MEYKFYKVTQGAFIDLVKKSILDNEAAKKEMSAFKGAVGATDVFQYNSGGIAYFTFKSQPSMALWKKANDGFLPRRGTKDGKALSEQLRKLPVTINLQDCLSIFKLTNMMVLGEPTSRGVRMHRASFCGKHDIETYFVKVPQEKGQEYKPVSSDMVECKEWEMLKFMDED